MHQLQCELLLPHMTCVFPVCKLMAKRQSMNCSDFAWLCGNNLEDAALNLRQKCPAKEPSRNGDMSRSVVVHFTAKKTGERLLWCTIFAT